MPSFMVPPLVPAYWSCESRKSGAKFKVDYFDYSTNTNCSAFEISFERIYIGDPFRCQT